MKKLSLILFFGLLPFALWAQDSLKVMFYNLYRFPTNPPANREYLLKNILEFVQPDLLMGSEIINQDGSDRILNTSFSGLPDSFAAPRFVPCPTAGDDPLQQMAYYNTRKLTLLHQEAIHTIIRDINHYTFYLNTSLKGKDTVFLDAFVTHLKAGNGNTNRWLRGTMADSFVKALAHVPANHHVILAGDFNFYNSSESAYQKFTDTTNPIIMVDPINSPGDWHDNPAFTAIHTQATRLTLSGFGLGGASGGMDDRFDFILMSKNMETDSTLYYLPGSYKAVGNNGNCFNRSIDNDTCTGIYPLPLRHILFQMSDHAPVVMTLLTPGQFPNSIASIPPSNPKIILFPNGNIAHEQLSIIIKNNRKSYPSSPLIIYDLAGRILKEFPIASHQTKFTLDISNISSGMYFIRYREAVERFINY